MRNVNRDRGSRSASAARTFWALVAKYDHYRGEPRTERSFDYPADERLSPERRQKLVAAEAPGQAGRQHYSSHVRPSSFEHIKLPAEPTASAVISRQSLRLRLAGGLLGLAAFFALQLPHAGQYLFRCEGSGGQAHARRVVDCVGDRSQYPRNQPFSDFLGDDRPFRRRTVR